MAVPEVPKTTSDSPPVWLRDDLLRLMPHLLSPPWVSDRRYFDAEAAADSWQRIGIRSAHILTKHVNGVMLYPSALRDDKPERDFFGEQVEACAARDIKVVAYYCVGFDNWAGAAYPEWLIRDEFGDLPDTTIWASPSWMCISSPWRAFALDQLAEIAANYPISGFWLDIVGLPVDIELCFCDNCARSYNAYGGPARLLNAKGSEEHWEFKMWHHRRFIEDAREILRRHDREPAVIFNGAGAPFFKLYAQPYEGSDSESSECHHPLLLGAVARLNRNGERPFELLSTSETSWAHAVLKPDTLVELEAFAVTVHGGTYTAGITHTPQGWISPGNIERLTRINAKLERQRDLLRGTEPVYDVGIVAPWDNREMRTVIPQVWRWVEFMRQGHLLFNLLPGYRNLEAQRVVVIPGGLAMTEADVQNLRQYVQNGGNLLVEAPTPRRGDDGPYLLEDLVGVRYQGRSPAEWHYLDPALEILRRDGMTHDPMQVASPADRVILLGAEQIGTLVHQFTPRDLAHIIWTEANTPEREPAGEPGITVNRLGKGRVAFVVGQLSAPDRRDETNPWLAILAQNLVAMLLHGRPAVAIQASGRIELVANRRRNRLILHLLNHAYGPSATLPAIKAEIEARGTGSAEKASGTTAVAVPPQTVIHSRGETDRTAPIRVQIDLELLMFTPTRAFLVPQDIELPVTHQGNTLTFEIPGVGVQQTVVVE